MTERNQAQQGTQAVDRAAALVAMVVQADEPITFTELAEASGLARSTTSRLLSALERTRLLERDESGAYVPGALFALYSARHDQWSDVVRLARPTLRKLQRDTGETVNLGIPRGDTVVQIAQETTRYVLGARDWVGVDVPAHCSALGKAMYAFDGLSLPRAPLETPTQHSIDSLDRLEQDIRRVRRLGYATTSEELEIGLSAVAVPVRDRAGNTVAALGVSGPTVRLEGRVDQFGRLLLQQAEALSGLLRNRMLEEGVA
ncbi:IclR family transcriptional regulator [Dactylosporangium sp. NPDC005572]|uniref:IclR family transcriptional regulator n=1 Tax=Dactylosporangium sp. NPDC005572 TaxID=3156889 RepID=UPI0033AE63DB